ncbi:MAG: hypothetical protein A2381_18100 [Bdellovibrionales bacterium RIFOXYB1_FULL_37_110]|nr:MAG: hypothetical protein A2417_06565 [Bdellovibrionales bacterium RIFOXYC1_FULL_37_79]OFZ58586.1 MAG: hypothetical protein A2381_18100 [Bdellovibrionales bacterium RIFOXYB1_FULL_37_110]OFZ61752.1 MAG: hypothetical protein A2577_19590 [Bdellovibrionales bacterium RIFOXYD1_FULL_36_51]
MKGLLIVLLLTTGFTTFAFVPGQREGGGGNVLAAEFASVGRIALEILGRGDDSLDVISILEAIKSTKITPVRNICFLDLNTGSQSCFTAYYNASENEIKFNNREWKELNCRSKMMLASHEYLRVAGVETEDYKFSGRFLLGNFVREGMDFDESLKLRVYVHSVCADIEGGKQ